MELELGMDIVGNSNINPFDEGFDINEEENPIIKEEEEKEPSIEVEEEEKDIESEENNDFIDANKQEGVNESEDDKQPSEDKANASPIYSTIAKSLFSDGIISLEDFDEKSVNSPEDLASLLQKQVESMLSEQQKRIKNALDNNLDSSEISQYENIISYLDKVDESKLSERTKEGDNLRSNIMFQDFVNNGISEDKAKKLIKASFAEGNDIEDALESLQNNKKYYSEKYNSLLENKIKEKETLRAKELEDSKKLKEMFINNEEPIKGIKLNKTQRENLYMKSTKFVGKDKEGRPLTEIQKYAVENPLEYQYNINLLYSLTNGFKDLSTVIKKEVSNKTKSAMQEIEKVINTSAIPNVDNYKFGNSKDENSKDFVAILD